MEMTFDSLGDIYEVEKIINRKTFRNKKYYLIKWLCYPINQCTWEPRDSLKHLNYLLEDFEARYPFSVDQDMYHYFCEEVKKKRRINKKAKKIKESENEKKFLAKKKKIEYFSDTELNNHYFDQLKRHLYINLVEKQKGDSKSSSDELIIDLSSTSAPSEENIVNIPIQESYLMIDEEKKDMTKLIMPKMI